MGQLGQLEITTLGGVLFKQNRIPLIGLSSLKARALVIYLARTGRPHSRESLAGLFWPDLSARLALANLRKLLTRLRPYLGTYLIINHQTIAFDQTQPYRLDVQEFERQLSLIDFNHTPKVALCRLEVGQIEKALALYQGDFLKGFTLPDSHEFEEWVLQEQEHLHQLAVKALEELINYQLAAHNYPAGLLEARRLVQLDPLHEEAHRQLMVLLIKTGQRSEALKHYLAYQRYLASEIEMLPEPATTALYERIRAGKLEEISPQLNLGADRVSSPVREIPITLNRVARLKRIGLFADISPQDLNKIADMLEETNFKANQTIFKKGELGHCMYIIVEGQVRIHDGNRLINDLANYDIFGEMALLDATSRLATATALVDTRLWRLEQHDLYRLMDEQMGIMRGIMQILALRLRERVQDLLQLAN